MAIRNGFYGVAISTTNILSHYFDKGSRFVSIQLIEIYQKYISPNKGFSCAYRIYQRGESCSQYAKRQIRKQGLLKALPLIRSRFQDCKVASLTQQNRGYSVGYQQDLFGHIQGKYMIVPKADADCGSVCLGCADVVACCSVCTGNNSTNDRDLSV